MNDTLGRRIFLSHLALSYRFGRKVTLAEFGELIANHLGRRSPFTAAAVSRWESGAQVPSLQIIEAIAELTGSDPGWISHGSRSAAPRPRRLPTPSRSIAIVDEAATVAERKPRAASSARKPAASRRRS